FLMMTLPLHSDFFQCFQFLSLQLFQLVKEILYPSFSDAFILSDDDKFLWQIANSINAVIIQLVNQSWRSGEIFFIDTFFAKIFCNDYFVSVIEQEQFSWS